MMDLIKMVLTKMDTAVMVSTKKVFTKTPANYSTKQDTTKMDTIH